jgi:hypothetical protein
MSPSFPPLPLSQRRTFCNHKCSGNIEGKASLIVLFSTQEYTKGNKRILENLHEPLQQ